jgi:thioredoxin 1
MIHLTNENFKPEIEDYQGLAVIDLWATWCGPCRMLAPIFESLADEHPEIKFCKINVDEQPELARMFKVQSIPAVAFVKDNTFLDMSVGFVPKASLVKLIEENK